MLCIIRTSQWTYCQRLPTRICLKLAGQDICDACIVAWLKQLRFGGVCLIKKDGNPWCGDRGRSNISGGGCLACGHAVLLYACNNNIIKHSVLGDEWNPLVLSESIKIRP